MTWLNALFTVLILTCIVIPIYDGLPDDDDA